MAGQQSSYLQFNPNSFFGGRRINARPRNVEYEEGTGPGTGRTARRVDPSVGSSAGNRSANLGGGLDAFYLAQRDKTRSMGDINREASIGREQGLMYNPLLKGYQSNSMYNRNPQTNPYFQQSQTSPMTEPQQEWARLAQEKQSGAGALGKIGEKMANVNPMFGAGMQAVETAVNAAVRPTFSANPYAGTRSQNIANAKAAGMFDKVRADYNKKNEATGMVMDQDGNITKNPIMAARGAVQKRILEQRKQGIR